MARFFINHPIFASVIAILIVLAGVLAIRGLGVGSYPNIAPPQVTVNTTYPGATAETAEGAVTQVIEQRSPERRGGHAYVSTAQSVQSPKHKKNTKIDRK